MPLSDSDEEQKRQELQRVFDLCDANGDGHLEIDELPILWSALSLPVLQHHDENLSALFNLMDRNGDGIITFDEFLEHLDTILLVIEQQQQQHAQESLELDAEPPAQDMDTSQGLLTDDALHTKLAEIFERCDQDHDGYIDVPSMQSLLEDLGFAQAEERDQLADAFKEVDLDGDGVISLFEFEYSVRKVLGLPLPPLESESPTRDSPPRPQHHSTLNSHTPHQTHASAIAPTPLTTVPETPYDTSFGELKSPQLAFRVSRSSSHSASHILM
jgi:Ca2+-binding EF-hand superfamily protein